MRSSRTTRSGRTMLSGRLSAVIALAFGMVAVTAPAQWQGPMLPAPQPFTLNSYDAIDVVALLYRVGFVQLRRGDESLRTIRVRHARSVWVGYEPEAYENHRNRYDVEVNGEPLDWDHVYIEYGGRMINLRLLYTYRNQRPVPPAPYRLP